VLKGKGVVEGGTRETFQGAKGTAAK